MIKYHAEVGLKTLYVCMHRGRTNYSKNDMEMTSKLRRGIDTTGGTVILKKKLGQEHDKETFVYNF